MVEMVHLLRSFGLPYAPPTLHGFFSIVLSPVVMTYLFTVVYQLEIIFLHEVLEIFSH